MLLDERRPRPVRAARWVAGPILCAVLWALTPAPAAAQPVRVIVEVTAGERPLAGAAVSAGEARAITDRDGRAQLDVPPGQVEIVVSAPAHAAATAAATVVPGAPIVVRVTLEPILSLEEEVIVTATRTQTRMQDQPVRVEVIDREEIEEKALMTPGSVAMLLGETTGLRVQTTAPSLGAGNVRIQGLRGRYAQLVADGLPLYGGQADSFSLFQVPPLDLGQVEIIKGVASALYGASALGGVINLVSRRPREHEAQVMLNGTSQLGRDLTTWVARAPNAAGWSWTLLGGYHGQTARDLDGDRWTDVPAFERGIVRPRLFFDNRRGTTALATVGVTVENRQGGTLEGAVAPDGAPFVEALDSRRFDGGLVFRRLTAGGLIVTTRGSAMRLLQTRRFGAVTERGVRATGFVEASVQGASGRHTWVAGGAFQQDRYRPRELRAFAYTFSTPAVFAQDEIAVGRRLTVALSARADWHSEYGVLATPRVSVLARPSAEWTLRLSGGTGAFAPTPFTEETEETGLTRLQPLSGIRAERARGGSVDVTRRVGPLEITATAFGSLVRDPVQLRVLGTRQTALTNAEGPTRSWGTELLARYRVGEFVLLATHAWTRSTEVDPVDRDRREVPLTPAHTGSLNLMWETEQGRLGLEAYATGRQPLEDNPYRAAARRQFLVGALLERRVGRARFFVNGENLLDVRQTKHDPLVLPARAADGRWTVDAWAPLEGRVINGGVRVTF